MPEQLDALAPVLVANRGEIAVPHLPHPLRRLGLRSVAVFSDADAGAPHVRAADAAVRIGPADARASYLSIEALLDAARATGARAVHLGPASSRRERRLRAGGDRRRPDVDRPAAAGDRADGRQGAGQAAGPPGERAGRARDRGRRPQPRADRRLLRRARLPRRRQGGRGRRRQGMRVVRAEGELESALAAARARGVGRLRRRARAGRALSRSAAPHRGAGARRRARHRAPPRRARVLPPAPPPEGRRGGAVAGRRPGVAGRDGARRRLRSRAPAATSAPAPSS